jgi:hypothetical protein
MAEVKREHLTTLAIHAAHGAIRRAVVEAGRVADAIRAILAEISGEGLEEIVQEIRDEGWLSRHYRHEWTALAADIKSEQLRRQTGTVAVIEDDGEVEAPGV